MNLIPVIIDRGLEGGGERSAPCSVLGLPLGYGSVLDRMVTDLACLQASRIWIVSDGCGGGGYGEGAQGNGSPRLEVVDQGLLATAFDQQETSDYLLVLEASNWPTGGVDFVAAARSAQEYYGATHWVAIGSAAERATERIECDADGRVRRVLRLYDAKNWHEVAGDAIAYSVVPARSAAGTRFRSLGELRQGLAVKGVLSRDVPEASDLLDLTEERAFLALAERVVMETVSRRPISDGYRARGPGVLVGPGSRIGPAVRLVPPVIIQENVTIQEGATIIGPSLIGAGCHIGRGAIVAQSVLSKGSTISREVSVRHRLCSGWCDVSTGGTSGNQGSAGELAGRSPGRLSRVGGELSGSEAQHPVRMARRVNLVLKRFMDVVISALSLVVLSPLLLVVGVLIKLDSRGPVFFCHRRESRGGKEFPCVKFRTMRVDAHSKQRDLYRDSLVDGPQFKLADDPRATRVGRWLRATNIDELPQLVNVLVGHMSLVGPRPSPFRENQICVPWRRARLSVRPGITGLWQVCRDDDRSRGGFHEWIYYDIIYVRHFSGWLDTKIVLATFATLAGRWRVPLRWLVRRAEHRRAQGWSIEGGQGVLERQELAGASVVSGGAIS